MDFSVHHKNTNLFCRPILFNFITSFLCAAQSLCKGETDKEVSIYSNHINLLSPGYPHSYPGNPRPSLVCATRLFLTSDPQHHVTNLQMNVMYLDMDLLEGEYVVMCYNNTLHIGATYDDLGSRPTENCHDASKSFQIYKSLQIVYHYHNNPYQPSNGVLLKVSGKILLKIVVKFRKSFVSRK